MWGKEEGREGDNFFMLIGKPLQCDLEGCKGSLELMSLKGVLSPPTHSRKLYRRRMLQIQSL